MRNHTKFAFTTLIVNTPRAKCEGIWEGISGDLAEGFGRIWSCVWEVLRGKITNRNNIDARDTVETYDKKLHVLVLESGFFLLPAGYMHIYIYIYMYSLFWTRNPMFRSKLFNSGVQRSRSESLDFLS